MLVVAPSGNDGGSGSGFGSISAPGSAPAALTVGALDARREVLEARVVVRAGLDTLLDRPVRILGAFGAGRPVRLAVAVPLRRAAGGRTDPSSGFSLAEYVDDQGRSRVAGRAVLVPADGRPLIAKARSAAAAGAAALLVYGTMLPAGGLDLDETAGIPVLAVPALAGRSAVDALIRGASVSVTITGERLVSNAGAGAVAAFSSRGLAFDGRVGPDLVAPGVGLATADARVGVQARYATVTGTSAAAALVAGAAALLAQARPGLDPAELAGLLVGSAEPVGGGRGGVPVLEQGAGEVRPRAALSADFAVRPSSLALGRADRRNWQAERTLVIRNLSGRALPLRLELVRDQPGRSRLAFAASPSRFRLEAGASTRVRIVVSAPRALRATLSGVLVIRAAGSRPTRVPWAVAPRTAAGRSLVGDVRLSHDRFAPSAFAPVVLAFRAGRIVPAAGGETIEPVGLLELELLNDRGRRLGILARERDLLPGRYAFGLTGRGPNGRKLPPGRYVVRLRATAVDGADGSPPSLAETTFVIERP
jgi:hypothetical protein